MFTVVLLDENNSEVGVPARVMLAPEWYDASELGGPQDCDVAVTGPVGSLWALKDWLGYKITVLNKEHDPVWWGVVEAVLLNMGSGQVGWSLKEVRNRLAVAYTDERAGTSVRGTTAWAEDVESVRRYGRREHLESRSGLDATAAAALRDRLLLESAAAHRQLTLGRAGGTGATLRCVGRWAMLANSYYAQPAGLELYDGDQTAQQPLGQGLTATTIGFTKDGYIHDTSGRLHTIADGGGLRVSGATNGGNNGNVVVKEATRVESKSLVAATVSFTASDTISDSASNLGLASENDFIVVAGAASGANNGTKRVVDAGGKAMKVDPSSIVTAAASPTITITRGNKILTDAAAPVQEFPGATVTLTVHGQEVAQGFSLATNANWTVGAVSVRLRRVGSPTDGVTLYLRNSASALPGGTLEAVTVAASEIGEEMSNVVFAFSNSQTINYGSNYFISLLRSGANDLANYYELEVSEAAGYGRGSLLLYTGAAWVARAVAASLNFRVIGKQETTKQIGDVVAAAATSSAYVAGTDVVTASGVYSEQYRAGDGRALAEIVELLSSGALSGRITAMVTKEGLLRVQGVPASEPGQALRWTAQRTVLAASGQPLPHGQLPVGQWVVVDELPESVAASTGLSPFFCGYARMDCRSGELELRPSEQADVMAPP